MFHVRLATVLVVIFLVFQDVACSEFLIIGGNFSTALNKDRSSVLTNNIVVWDVQAQSYKPLGMGANSVVHTVHIDSCNNVWIGGDFSYVQGSYTGPIAYFNTATNTWSTISSTIWESYTQNSVYAITTDCANVGVCQCDVYIGGNFRLYDSQGASAFNVAKWSSLQNRWDDLGGFPRSGINGYVTSLYKLEEGLTDRSKLLWVGGTFTGFFKVFNFKDRSWGTVPGLNGPVWDIEYQANIFSTDDIWIAGEFNTPTCKYVCHYNRKTDTLTQMGMNSYPNSTVKTLGLVNGKLYAVGNFDNESIYRVARIPIGGKAWESIPGVRRIISEAPWDICVKDGNLSIAGPGGVFYFDTNTELWYKIGNGIEGVAQTVTGLRL